MTDATSGIRNERILFQPVDDQQREEITEFTTSSQRVIIGRKMSAAEDAQATPVYVLKTDVGDRIGPTSVTREDQAQTRHGRRRKSAWNWNRSAAWSPARKRCSARMCTSVGARWPTNVITWTSAAWTTSKSPPGSRQ